MEGGIKNRHLLNSGRFFSQSHDPFKVKGVVKRGQRNKGFDRLDHLVIYHHGLMKFFAAMYHPMDNNIQGGKIS